LYTTTREKRFWSHRGVEPKPTRDFGRHADRRGHHIAFEADISRWKNGLRFTIVVRSGTIRLHKVLGNLFLPAGGHLWLSFFAKFARTIKDRISLNMPSCLPSSYVLVIGTVRLIGGNANNAFSTVASTLGTT